MPTTTVEELTKRARQLRGEGRLEESVLAARRATTLGPDDAGAWWQLALSLDEKDGGDAALAPLERVTELAPHFAAGWCEVGRIHHEASRLTLSLDAYEQALEADGGHVHAMHMVASLLKEVEEDKAPKRRLALLRVLFEKDELDANELFDLAYLLGEANEPAEAVAVYERYTREHGGLASFFNLALGYRELGRGLDALDALETAHQRGYDNEGRKTVLAQLRVPLLKLREQVHHRARGYLPQPDWYKHYINPFTLLNVEPGDIENNAKALQKARQALLREIELEDGKVEWLPGLVIDKSMAMATLSELDSNEAWQAHKLVFLNWALNNFMMCGDLEHFLIAEDGSTDAILPHLLNTEVLERISTKFAAQYDVVLSRAVETADLSVVQCLLSGRRWVSPVQQDACFESTRRLLSRLSEPLLQLVSASESRPVSRAEIDRAFKHRSLGRLLELLPVEFYETHSAVGAALRSLSVSFYNRERDAATAKGILALGRVCAEKSPALAHQLEADEQTLDKFIADEKKSEAHLSFKDRNVSITRAGVVFGAQKLAPADIMGVRWGFVQTSAQPPTYRLTVGFQAFRNEELVVSWTTSSNLEQQKKYWESLVDATMEFILDTVVNTFQRQLDNNEPTSVGQVQVLKAGVVLTVKGWFSDKQVLVPWTRLKSVLTNGSVVLQDVADPKAKAALPIESTYNAFLLHIMANRKDSARS